MSYTNAIEILRAARNFLDAHSWTQGTSARDSEGNRCSVLDLRACSYCAVGAILAVAKNGNAHLALEALIQRIGAIGPFNDADCRTKQEVLVAFDTAIADLEAS